MLSLLVRRELRASLRSPHTLLQPVLFFTLTICLFPLASGADNEALARIAPAALWIALLLAALLASEQLFAEDYADGTLSQDRIHLHELWQLLAAKLAAAEADAAAIAGKMAAERYGVPLRYPHIEDDGNNTTRFLVIGKQASSPSGHDKTTILVSSQNRPGLLYKLLEPIGRHGINMTRIESRPSKQGIWEYIFFIDLDGHQSEPQMQALLAEIEDSASLFRVLGSYPQSVLQ